jgi:hypothetical protein
MSGGRVGRKRDCATRFGGIEEILGSRKGSVGRVDSRAALKLVIAGSQLRVKRKRIKTNKGWGEAGTHKRKYRPQLLALPAMFGPRPR